ncbi:MAG: glycosyltransferase [Thermoplasmata archaeon]
MAGNESVSVVINVYNEEENIEDCLSSLEKQSLSGFELVVVDDGSTDDTMKIVEEFRDNFEMKTFRTEHVGIKKARRKGVEESSGDVVVIVDADEILEPDFLENLVEPFDDDEVGAVGGRLRSEGEGWVTDAYGALNEAFYVLRAEGGEADWIQGGCSAYRREALEEVGGLAREKVSADKDVSWKLRDEGWKVVLEDEAVAYHRDPQTLDSVMKREFGIGLREYSLISKHKNRFGWKEFSRFFPLSVFLFLGLSLLHVYFLGFILLGVVGSFGMVSYLLVRHTERSNVVQAWVVLNLINLSWSLGFLKGLLGLK